MMSFEDRNDPPPVRDTRACYAVILCGVAVQTILAFGLLPLQQVYVGWEVEPPQLTALYFGLAQWLTSLWGIATSALLLLAAAFMTFEERGGRWVARCYCTVALLVMLSLSLPVICHFNAEDLNDAMAEVERQEPAQTRGAH